MQSHRALIYSRIKKGRDATKSGNPLVKQLAIPLSNQPKNFWPGTRKTIAKWLVISSKQDVELTQSHPYNTSNPNRFHPSCPSSFSVSTLLSTI